MDDDAIRQGVDESIGEVHSPGVAFLFVMGEDVMCGKDYRIAEKLEKAHSQPIPAGGKSALDMYKIWTYGTKTARHMLELLKIGSICGNDSFQHKSPREVLEFVGGGGDERYTATCMGQCLTQIIGVMADAAPAA